MQNLPTPQLPTKQRTADRAHVGLEMQRNQAEDRQRDGRRFEKSERVRRMEEVKKAKAVMHKASEMAFSARDLGLFSTAKTTPKPAKEAWIAGRDLWITDIDGKERVITPVVIREYSSPERFLDTFQRNTGNQYRGKAHPKLTRGFGLYWMDCITGSLFDNDGCCQTSDTLRMNTLTIRKHNERAGELLMSAKAVDLDEAKEDTAVEA